MTRIDLSPRTRGRVCARGLFSLLAPLAIAATCGHASQIQAQTRPSRPVARLAGTSKFAPPVYPASPAPSARVCSAAARYSHAGAVRFAATGDERRAFDLINGERRARGMTALQWDGEMARMAREHSEEMGRGDFLAHTDAAGRDTFARAAARGVCGWSALGENIAYNQGFEDPVAFAVERWMKSSKHRDNILRADFTHSGLGISRTPDGRVYFTQVFVTR